MGADRRLLTRVVLRNYKSIAACDVSPAQLTFLVGPNGSGKSNFLDALRFVADAVRWKWQLEKGPLWPREKGPPSFVSLFSVADLLSGRLFLGCRAGLVLRLRPIGGVNVRMRTVGSEPDVGVGHARSGYPRETERPGWAGRCDRRRTGEGVPSSDNPSAAEGSSGARGGGGDDRHRLLRQASL